MINNELSVYKLAHTQTILRLRGKRNRENLLHNPFLQTQAHTLDASRIFKIYTDSVEAVFFWHSNMIRFPLTGKRSKWNTRNEQIYVREHENVDFYSFRKELYEHV